jgi:two-component system, OmpR family, osmolarity sensor histidine kinase EnvZ
MRLPWPRSLLARNLVLLTCVVLASQAAAYAIFMLLIQQPRIDEVASLIASQTRLVDQLLVALPEADRHRQLVAINGGEQAPGKRAQPFSQPYVHSYLERRFMNTLSQHLPPGSEILLERGGETRIWIRQQIGGEYDWMVLPISTEIGGLLPWNVLGLLMAIALFPVLGAWLIQRYLAGPLRRLAEAAASTELGVWPEPVPTDGPTELATVAEAFNRMVASLAELEATRNVMLAGISHDIRTPLTKLRMAISAPEAFDAPLASAERFADEIDAIVGQFIDYARGWDNEPARPGDLNALIEQLAGDYAGLGHMFELSLEPLPAVAFRPVGMQRLLVNLMHNAVVHGKVGLAVRTRREAGGVMLAVDDAGPGVPEAMLPLLKQPFRRVEGSGRPSGTGLGLAIAERIARQHGGRLDLVLRPEGGLSVVLRLPCA